MRKILFVCGGNTCRSPMAKAILEKMLKERGLQDEIIVDSAARNSPTHPEATNEARIVINQLYDGDLLSDHRSKSVEETDLDEYDLILTMEESHKYGLPQDRTCTLKEFAGSNGDISDPYRKPINEYQRCRNEIKDCLDKAIERIVADSANTSPNAHPDSS